MTGADNSAKRDRISITDISKIIEIENRTGIYPVSWYAKEIWEHIKSNYHSHSLKSTDVYRDGLKQNMTNFMYLLYEIIISTEETGKELLAEFFLQPNYSCFEYDYKFNNSGDIINITPRHRTESSYKDIERYRRIALDAVINYVEKDNRNAKSTISDINLQKITDIISKINSNSPKEEIKAAIIEVMESIQADIIVSF